MVISIAWLTHEHFEVYRANPPDLLSDEPYIGRFFVQGEAAVDPPSVKTTRVATAIDRAFAITYSLTKPAGWTRYLSRAGDADHFRGSLQDAPLAPPPHIKMVLERLDPMSCIRKGSFQIFFFSF